MGHGDRGWVGTEKYTCLWKYFSSPHVTEEHEHTLTDLSHEVEYKYGTWTRQNT